MIENAIVEIWRRLAAGDEDGARQRLLLVWQHYCDELQNERVVRLTLRLLDRLGFSTDAPNEWEALPDPLKLYRVGPPDGLAWTVDRDVAESLAEGAEIVTRTEPKSAALAFIVGRGEAEIVLRPSI
jgi:hypothetical protein